MSGNPSLWGHPDVESYIESLEVALGWHLRQAEELDSIDLLISELAEDTAVFIDEKWREHLMSIGSTHPDD